MAAAPVPGCVVEFGEYQGHGLCALGQLARRYLSGVPPIYGFDSFAGMPPSGKPLKGALTQFWAPGTFSDTSQGAVQARLEREDVQAALVPGVFSDLWPLGEYGISRIRFANLDGDIYEGYRNAVRLLTPHLQGRHVPRFDESIPPNEARYQSVREHG